MKEWIKKEARPLLIGRAMLEEFDAGNMLGAVTAWKILDFVEKAIEPRKEKIRLALLGWAEKLGEATEKGGSKLSVAGNVVLREKRVGAQPEEGPLKKMLEEKGLRMSEVFDEVKKVVLNPSKLQSLIETGKLDKAAVEKLHKVSWALRVYPSDELEELLESAAKSKNGNGNGK